MKYLEKEEEKEALSWIEEAIQVAQSATCLRAKCGAVIVKDGKIIGVGFNSPPGNDEKERRCKNKKKSYDEKVTDKTCCVHAEQRAIMDALRNSPDNLESSKLYFARFYADGERRLLGGENKMYCTICTKMMRDVGIAEFILAHQEGVALFSLKEYNETSFSYKKE